MTKKKVNIYKAFERFWHWVQSLLILFLILTGFEIHGSYEYFGFEKAVDYHNIAGIALIVLVIFAIFWHLTTDEWRQYIPTVKNLKAQLNYYIFGIFKGAPHPHRKTQLSKLNPMQKLVYFGLKILVIPVVGVTGLLYLYYRYPQEEGIASINISGLETVALLHTIGAFLIAAFLIIHLYLITTGQTITSNLKAMITGYEELEGDEEKKSDAKNTIE
jgi:formate dehydrogenase gamma subunit